MRRVVIKEFAAESLISAFLWYEKLCGGLGFEFLDEWEITIAFLCTNAESFEKKYKNFRQAGLKRFPYLIVFEIEENEVIVYNVINSKRSTTRRFQKRKRN